MSSGSNDKGKIGGVKGTGTPRGIEKTRGVSDIEKAEKTSAVRGVGKTSGPGRIAPTKIMTKAEREHLFRMIDEEATKLFGKGKMPAQQQEIVSKAVKMAVDAAIIDEPEEEES